MKIIKLSILMITICQIINASAPSVPALSEKPKHKPLTLTPALLSSAHKFGRSLGAFLRDCKGLIDKPEDHFPFITNPDSDDVLILQRGRADYRKFYAIASAIGRTKVDAGIAITKPNGTIKIRRIL